MSRGTIKHEIHSARRQFPTRGERVDTSTGSARSIGGRVVMIGVGGGAFLPFQFFHAAATGEQITPSQAPEKRCP